MKTTYTHLSLDLPVELIEPMIALLADVGYEAFEEKETGLEAYILTADYQEDIVVELCAILGQATDIFTAKEMPSKNWNETWEAQYAPIYIDDFCQVIASFKAPLPDFTHTLIIDPKMSFGTGHHETTRLVIRHMKEMTFEGKVVLDMGCGTGLLGILAAKMGAKSVCGIDIDVWSKENAEENIRLNQVQNMEVWQGDATTIPSKTFDIILANINRNVLLHDVAKYALHMNEGDILIASGYYRQDEMQIAAAFAAAGLMPFRTLEENLWLSQAFTK